MPALVTVALTGQGCREAVVPDGLELHPGDICAVECHGVTYLGQVRHALASPEDGVVLATAPRCLRIAGQTDLERERANAGLCAQALQAFAADTADAPQSVRPAAAWCDLDRKRMTIVYSSERPYDGRRLAAALQKRFGIEVELRQIGVRDEAALLGGLGSCGRPVCCATWLRRFQSVNVRMAKEQDISLNPANINGTCGRLKCCLRYEFESYSAANAVTPREGVWVTLRDGSEGCVVERDVMRGLLKLRTRAGRVVRVALADVREAAPAVTPAEPKPEEQETENGNENLGREWTEPGTPGET
ncbi:MAG: regulatory iron-sulfur-containing complex subunit RicT [Kiritimatiellae bacterium]|nr:regulatory iron-sulfur-containing complex subunit RicT [Kiritimatiellia bacterium]